MSTVLAILSFIGKPVFFLFMKFLEKRVETMDDATKIFDKIANTKNKELFFNKDSVKLIKEIDMRVAKGEDLSLYEMKHLIHKMYLDNFEDGLNILEDELRISVSNNLDNYLVALRRNYNGDTNLKSVAFDKVFKDMLHRDTTYNKNNLEEVILKKNSNNLIKTTSYNNDYVAMVELITENARSLMDSLLFTSQAVYIESRNTFLFAFSGHGAVSVNNMILDEIFRSAEATCPSNVTLSNLTGTLGLHTYNRNVDPRLLHVNVEFDVRNLSSMYSGIASSIIGFVNILQRHSSHHNPITEYKIIVSNKQQEMDLKNALLNRDTFKVHIA